MLVTTHVLTFDNTIKVGNLFISLVDSTPNRVRIMIQNETLPSNAKPDYADWVIERSSGHLGFRNTKTGEWKYYEQFIKEKQCKCESD